MKISFHVIILILFFKLIKCDLHTRKLAGYLVPDRALKAGYPVHPYKLLIM